MLKLNCLNWLWSRLLYNDLWCGRWLGHRYLAQLSHELLAHRVKVLLSDHLVLLELKFSLSNEELVLLVLYSLIQLADL